MNWTYRGNNCPPGNDPSSPLYNYGHGLGRFRPLHATGTGKFIVLFEIVSSEFDYTYIATAVADKPEGPYKWHDFLRLDGKPVHGADTAVFTDDDGTQYFITAAPGGDNVADWLYQLAPDCLSAVKVKHVETGGEGAAMFKSGGFYYLLHSHLSGMDSNDNFYHTATNIWRPWIPRGNIAQGEHSAQTFLTRKSREPILFPLGGVFEVAAIHF